MRPTQLSIRPAGLTFLHEHLVGSDVTLGATALRAFVNVMDESRSFDFRARIVHFKITVDAVGGHRMEGGVGHGLTLSIASVDHTFNKAAAVFEWPLAKFDRSHYRSTDWTAVRVQFVSRRYALPIDQLSIRVTSCASGLRVGLSMLHRCFSLHVQANRTMRKLACFIFLLR